MRRIHGLVIASLLIVAGCSSGEYEDTYTSPTPTFSQETTQATTPTAEAQSPPASPQVTVPNDLVGKNMQLANEELHKLGFTNIDYASPDGNGLEPQLNDDWTVTKVDPAPGTVIWTADMVRVTATKKQEQVAPAPPPLNSAPLGSPYYPNCAAVRAAGAAPLHRGEPGYRPALDRDGDGIACE